MSEKIRVLMVSTSYPEGNQDWRGRFIANIVSAMARRTDLELSLWAPPGNLPELVADATTTAESAWLHALAARGGIAAALRVGSLRAINDALGLIWRLRQVYRRTTSIDVVHVNWLQNALPLWGLTTPAIITVLGTDFGLLRHALIRQMLRAVIRQRRCIIAPNAAWMTTKLQESFGDIASVETIPFGVDPVWFRIQRSTEAPIKPRWLVVSRVTAPKIGALIEWGHGLFNETRELHLLGPKQELLTLAPWVNYHGPTNPEELIRNWFPQSTGLITLSRHDEGRPQVILEAMAAGLPVIASDLPAHRDVIQHGSTGWLVRSAEELAEALSALETPEINRSIGEKARKWVADQIGTWDDCIHRYQGAYRRLVEANGVTTG
jgi:glycosyltransferase involved in cell wall biosynthesis